MPSPMVSISEKSQRLLQELAEQTGQSMMQTIQTNQYLGPSSKARVIYFLLGHTWDIYDQMAVYLRLNGIVPPASQRP